MSDADADIKKERIDEEGQEQEDGESGDSVEESTVTAAKPLATTRSRRANAGNRMGHIIQYEEDEFYSNLYGGFDEEEDDADFVDEGGADDDDDGRDDSDAASSSSSDNEDEEDDENEAEDEESGQDCPSEMEEPSKKKIETSKDVKSKATKAIQPSSSCDRKPQLDDLNARPGSPSKAAYDACKKICCVCLVDQRGKDDEIIECDACGVSVHESCYGVPDEDDEELEETVSDHSNISSESTEPWFCEPCRRSVRNPYCELCPNTGGIFKQTDTGRWVHMVCALYTRGVTFENIDTLTEVSLFELNYALYGSKACTICEDRRLARSGICIGCDAGLCKAFFHATCAQREGLLFESHSDEVDPYFAQCKQHADKSTIKKKKKLCTALFARLRRIQPLQDCPDRITNKLAKITQEKDPHLSKWTPDNRPPIPPKVSRMLMTSPSLIMRLTKKSELMGLDPKSAFMTVQDESEMARQKWHIPPAFDLEFVAYCKDRTPRMISMKKRNVELVSQNANLKIEEANLREKYNSIKEVVDKLRLDNENLIKEARAIQKTITASTGKQFNLPLQMEQMIARCSNIRSKNSTKTTPRSSNKTNSTYGCGKCGTVKDQHLLALCDTCNSHLHIYCLDPPLTRVPKKTKFGGWQCSDCAEQAEEEQEEALEEQQTIAIQDVDGPRRLRERIKYPEKYCHESMVLADFWSIPKKKSKKSSSKCSKIKKET